MTNIGQAKLQAIHISTHCVDVDTLSYAGETKHDNWDGMALNMDTITLQSKIKPIVCSTIYDNKNKT